MALMWKQTIIISVYCAHIQDVFAAAVSLVTGRILYISEQASVVLRCNADLFSNVRFVELLAPQDVNVFYSSTNPYRLPSWSICNGGGKGYCLLKGISSWLGLHLPLQIIIFFTILCVIKSVNSALSILPTYFTVYGCQHLWLYINAQTLNLYSAALTFCYKYTLSDISKI